MSEIIQILKEVLPLIHWLKDMEIQPPILNPIIMDLLTMLKVLMVVQLKLVTIIQILLLLITHFMVPMVTNLITLEKIITLIITLKEDQTVKLMDKVP